MIVFQVNKHYKITYIDGDKTYKIQCKILDVRKWDIMVEWDQLGKGWRSRFGINVILSTGWIKYTTITDYEEL